MFGFDLASKDDIKKELYDIGVYGDASHIIQRLRHCSHAIVDIITSTPCLTKNDIKEKIIWLRKYYSIKERKYRSIAERHDYENKLLDFWENVQKSFSFEVLPYGIDVERKQIALSYTDYKKYSKFLSLIWKAKIFDDENYIVEFNKEEFSSIDKNIANLIECIAGRKFEDNGKKVRIVFAKCNDYDKQTILSYITINVLNNISVENEQMRIVTINNQELLKYISSIIHMTAKDYMEAFWRVGDRGDHEEYYKDVVIEFDEEPNAVIRSILMDVVPELSTHNNSKFEYHFSESEIARGYGRSWDWQRNDDYKNSMLVELIIRFFGAYKEGLYIDLNIFS
jgi:hypothetical protein